MFAYCCNNPVAYCDEVGTARRECLGFESSILLPYQEPTSGGGMDLAVAVLGIAIAAVVIVEILQISHEQSKKPGLEAYDYQQVLKQEQVMTKPQLPHVHHIVPVGNFSGRSIETQKQIQEMHDILRRNGIDRFFAPMNLVLVSAKTHSSLHTDAYIAHVYSYIKQAEGSRAKIYAALFWLRIEIAAMDGFAIGY